jgi:hypothetical protein
MLQPECAAITCRLHHPIASRLLRIFLQDAPGATAQRIDASLEEDPTTLHNNVACCRECLQLLLWGGADAMAFNRAELLPLDMAAPASPVWATLEQELRWRTCLQVRSLPQWLAC